MADYCSKVLHTASHSLPPASHCTQEEAGKVNQKGTVLSQSPNYSVWLSSSFSEKTEEYAELTLERGTRGGSREGVYTKT